MSLIINNDYTLEESFDDKYNLEINDCVIDIIQYCNTNNLPFLNKFNYNDFMDIIKKNINFSKIEIINNEYNEEEDDELIDEDKYDENNYDDMCYG